jgi:hypothetical protein
VRREAPIQNQFPAGGDFPSLLVCENLGV